MKLYISSDIEGICGVTSWSETDLNSRESGVFIKYWVEELNKICNVAIENNCDEIYINDAHDTARNLLPSFFPEKVKLIRGWSGHPYMMIEHLDSSFDAVVFSGFHSSGSTDGNPISHTMNPKLVSEIRINSVIASEFLIFYYASLYVGVPVVLVTGDEGLCLEVKKTNEKIATVVTKKGISGSTINNHPVEILKDLETKTNEIFSEKNYQKFKKDIPEEFKVEIVYKKHSDAYKNSFYPNAKLDSSNTIAFYSKDYFEVLRFLSFVVI